MILFLIRAVNLFRIVAGYLISRSVKRVIHWGNPVAASIEPINCCNLHCPECPAGMKGLTRPHGSMQSGMFQSITSQLLPGLSYLTLYFQGEPYMSSHLFDFIAFARSKKIFVTTSTNGHFLGMESVQRTIASGLNRLIISLDGPDQVSYESYRRGGDLEKVIAGIRLLVSEKKRLNKRTPEIILQCLVLKSNEHKLDEIRRLSKELGVSKLVFKTAQFYDFENGNPLMPQNPKYSRYHQKAKHTLFHHFANLLPYYFNTRPPVRMFACPPVPLSPCPPVRPFTLRNRQPNSCFRMWSSCVITWDGRVVPCCFDKDATHVMGQLTEKSFREIWKGNAYHDFRKKILVNRKEVGMCGNCSQTF